MGVRKITKSCLTTFQNLEIFFNFRLYVSIFRFDERTYKVKMSQPQSIDTHWLGISNVNGAFQDSNREYQTFF